MEPKSSTPVDSEMLLTVYFFGKQPLPCIVSEISEKGIVVRPVNPDVLVTQEPLENDELVELHYDSKSDAPKLKVRGSVQSIELLKVHVVFLNPADKNVSELRRYFLETASRNSSSTAAVNYQVIRLEISNFFSEQLGKKLTIFLEDCDRLIMALATNSENNGQQNLFFEAKSLLKNKGQDITEEIQSSLKAQLCSDYPKTSSPSNETIEDEPITLVDIEEFEDNLSLDDAVRNGNNLYYKSQACLQERFGIILNRDVTLSNLPVGIYVISIALQKSLKENNFSHQLLPVLYKIFYETVVKDMDSVYDGINAKFRRSGILPDLESKVFLERRKKTRNDSNATKENLKTPDKEASQNLQATGHRPPQNSGISSTEIGEQLFSTVSDLLSLANKRNISSDIASITQSCDSQLIIDSLNRLSVDKSATRNLQAGGSILDMLKDQESLNLSLEQSNNLSVISTIFQNIGNYSQLSNKLASAFSKLQITVAKMAQSDGHFLSTPGHPAREFLNQLAELGLNSESPNVPLERKYESIVANIVDNYQDGSDVFAQGLNELESVSRQQDNSNFKNILRVHETFAGRQRLRNTQEAVIKTLLRRISPPQAPDIAVALVDQGWMEVLKLSHIKHGPKSEQWLHNISLLDQLLWWVAEIQSGEVDAGATAVRKQYAQSFTDKIARQLNDAFPADFQYKETLENIKMTLSGNRPITMIAVEENRFGQKLFTGDIQKELEEAHPNLRRWFQMIAKFRIGNEFSYIAGGAEQRNVKLAWISDHRQHFVFVNSCGHKVLDYDLIELAGALANGLIPCQANSQWSIVDNSMHSIVQDAYEDLNYRSIHDELTGLINRKESERRLTEAILDSKNNAATRCLICLDIDKFAMANNLYGQLAGDQLLVKVSDIISGTMPDEKMAARIAGNEFLILLEKIDFKAGKILAEKLRRDINETDFDWQEHKIKLSVSICIVTIDKYSENVVDLMRNVSNGCKACKQHGGNKVLELERDNDLQDRRKKMLYWIDKLNSVLNGDGFILRGQEIYSLKSKGALSHYEILLAIVGESGELESPEEFIEAAECYNRMQRVDRWVIENTFQWLRDLGSDSDELPAVSINLSGNSINDDSFKDYILEQFAIYKIPTSKICFEITETATINNLAEAADFIREIKSIGCKFSLDDFGSGNASYQYLKHLPVDYLKIDGMFVKDMASNKDDYALVKSINEIAHLMGKETIAEYVETDELVELLRDMGVDYVQGYAISRPTPLLELRTSAA